VRLTLGAKTARRPGIAWRTYTIDGRPLEVRQTAERRWAAVCGEATTIEREAGAGAEG